MAFLDFFKPKWKHSNDSVRKKAVEMLTNQEKLAFIAVNDSYYAIRNVAIGKLTDQRLIVGIVEKCKDSEISPDLLNKLTDQPLLSYIALNNRYEWTRRGALTNLNDLKILEDIAKKDYSWRVAQFAFERLNHLNPSLIEGNKEFWEKMQVDYRRRMEQARRAEDERYDDLRDAYERMSNTDPHESPFGFGR